jgi:phosphohistidine phosphatase
MLVGHNPGMHELAIVLAGSGDPAGRGALAENLPTAGLVILDFDVDDWTDIGLQRGRLELYVSPKLLKQTSGE